MKKSIISVVLMLIVFVGISILIYNNRSSNNINYMFTLDINPSIKVNVDSKDNVVDIKLLNKNAKDVFDEDAFKGESLDIVIEKISKELEKNNFIDKDKVIIIFNISDETKKDRVIDLIKKEFENKTDSLEIIIPELSEEAKKYSIRYKITEAKAAYILKLLDSNNKLKIEDVVNRPIDEIYYMLENGVYCDSDRSLKDGLCVKKVGESLAINKMVCKEGYYEHEKACYKASLPEIEYYCDNNYELIDNKCVNSDEKLEPNEKRNCIDGYELVDNYMCIDTAIKTDLVSAKVCEEDNSELNGDVCILYSVTQPYKN